VRNEGERQSECAEHTANGVATRGGFAERVDYRQSRAERVEHAYQCFPGDLIYTFRDAPHVAIDVVVCSAHSGPPCII